MPILSKLKAKLRRGKSLASSLGTHESDANTQRTPTASLKGSESQSQFADAPLLNPSADTPLRESPSQRLSAAQALLPSNPPSHTDTNGIQPDGDSPQDEDATVVEHNPTSDLPNNNLAPTITVTPVPEDHAHKDLWKLAGDLLDDSENNKLIIDNESTTNEDQDNKLSEDLSVNLKIDKILELTNAASKADKDKTWKTVSVRSRSSIHF